MISQSGQEKGTGNGRQVGRRVRTDGGEALPSRMEMVGEHGSHGVFARPDGNPTGYPTRTAAVPGSGASVEALEDEAPTRVAKPLIWIDMDNTPHVPFFKPIIRELERRGYDILLTARDAFQVCSLARREGLPFQKVGRHYGRNPVLKVFGLLVRGIQLLPLAYRKRPVIGLSHGARSQILVCNLLGIPSVLVMDYEFTTSPPLARPKWEIVPEALPDAGLHCRSDERIRKYRGIKEDVYAGEFRPDSSILDELSLRDASIVATVRPPATEAHYHNPESESLFRAFMRHAFRNPELRVVLLPRNQKQAEEVRNEWKEFFDAGRVVVPANAVNGLNLLWHSDLVVSGGGTMNREAAALGVPVYSIFRGKIGAVDRKLADEGRLTLITTVEDVESRIPLVPRGRTQDCVVSPQRALDDILAYVEDIIRLSAS